MRLLILGCSGFLGARLCRHLALAGHTVTGVARHPAASALPRGVRFVQATIDDRLAIAPLLAESDYVLHLAWDTTPGTSQGQPVLETGSNVLPSMRLLELLQEHPGCGIVFVSTGGALYASSAEPVDEGGALCPRSCYGAAKGAVELMLQAMNTQSGNRVLVLRPANVYGPGQTAKRGFGVVPTLMQCALNGTAFELWGDGSTARDYLYIDDFLGLVDRLLGHQWPAGAFERLNAGTGIAVPVSRLCGLVEEVSGRSIRRTWHETRVVDPPCISLDCSRAHALLGWTPGTSLAGGLRATWAWHRGTG